MAIRPNAEQLAELAAAADEGPVVMINLLKFKARAERSGVDTHETGADAYRRYGAEAVRMVEDRGGQVLWAGRADQILIGDPTEDYDQAILVQYPSRAAFLDMVSQPEYLEAHAHRESGLERTVLIACTPELDRIVEPGS